MTIKQNRKSNKMFHEINVLLTFNTPNYCGLTQEFFDVKLALTAKDKDLISYLNNKFFNRVFNYCAKRSRAPEDLIKISTASDWSLYEEITGSRSLSKYGHNGKWFFGLGRSDLDIWEMTLMSTYGFGLGADMSRVDEHRAAVAKLIAAQQQTL